MGSTIVGLMGSSRHRIRTRGAQAWALLAAGAFLSLTWQSVEAAEPPDELTVTARYPGPPLWKVSKGDHELWIFGTLGAVPKDMVWGSVAVERVIARAQEVLLPPGVNAWTKNPFRYLGLYRRVKKLSRNENDETLMDILPPDLYARYIVVRDRYVGKDGDLEQQRPAVVASRLSNKALDGADLTSGRKLQKAVERIAKGADVAMTDTRLHVDPSALLDEAESLSTEAEVECFATILSSIEHDLPGMAERARAWAVGDIQALRRFDYPDVQGDCTTFIGSSEGLQGTLEAADASWLDAAERALATNRTTFATLDMGDLIKPDGLLGRLRERGYDVTEP